MVKRFGRAASVAGKHVTHSPDCCLGNDGTKVYDFGDGKVDSSIGAHNKSNQKAVYKAVKGAPPDAKIKVKVKTADEVVK